MSKPRKIKETRVIRIGLENYLSFMELKDVYAIRHNMQHATYDQFLSELLQIARALQAGHELYAVDTQLYADIADARGAAILNAVAAKHAPVMPDILVKLGKDDGFTKVGRK